MTMPSIENTQDDEIDFAQMFAVLRAKRKALAVGTAITAAAIFTGVFYTKCQYQSTGFLRIPVGNVQFNTWKSSITDRHHFEQFLTATHSANDVASTSLLATVHDSLKRKHVVPVYPYSDDDLKNMHKDVSPSGILGFSISFDAKSPEEAQAKVALMGSFVKDTALRQELTDAVREGRIRTTTENQKLDNDLITKRFALAQDTRKLQELTALKAQYPDASKLETRQLVSSADGAYRYLSPVTQLVGISSQIADLKGDIDSLERHVAQNRLATQYYDQALKLTEKPGSGKELLTSLVTLKNQVFAKVDPRDDTIREVLNNVTLTLEGINARDSLSASFVSGPSLPTRRSGPGPVVLAIMSLLGGALLSAAGVLFLNQMGAATERQSDQSRNQSNAVTAS